ncbi:hypothetical protein AV274_1919 [Blastocystis sp. ATCC 50177/Nand II]|uniref:Uncharacterized protein n=1 Tax=Blastocystis sp. subtype 1 (strain ATCC 50177 / NandII) TaxID=478820 RepID=A0A196SH85_BLAHN|nr:hypothetical protein AV274_1919 [Blastocystis sp. ATCC 50177/Nand II]
MLLKGEDEEDRMRIVNLQKRIMELENAIQSLSTRLVKIREEAHAQIDEKSSGFDVKQCVKTTPDTRTHSRFRKGLESDVTRDVNEVLDLLNCGLVKEAGNELRRTKRTASVIQKELGKELSQVDRVMASVS